MFYFSCPIIYRAFFLQFYNWWNSFFIKKRQTPLGTLSRGEEKRGNLSLFWLTSFFKTKQNKITNFAKILKKLQLREVGGVLVCLKM